MKQLLTKAAIASTGLLFVAGMAFAGSNCTGYGSENESNFDWESKTTVDVNNHADIDNEIDAWLNTGENKVEHNNACFDCDDENATMGENSIMTGNASASVNVSNTANKATVNVTAPTLDMSDMDFGVGTTGANSENESRVKVSNETKVNVNNCADVDNDVDLNVNTGKNTASYNTGANNSITTGSATANVTISNNVNTADVTVK